MPFFFLLLCVLSCAPFCLSHTTYPYYYRRILHQPFFPLGSFPPAPPPLSSTRPKFPTSTNAPPFFPFYPSPPPPSPRPPLSSFPANISSLIFPGNPTSKSKSPKVAIAIVLPLIAVLILAALGVFYYRRRRNSVEKSLRSDNHHLFATPDGRKVGVSATNSDFLYLGTLVNSHRVEDDAGSGNVASNSPYQKLGSPELHPLPPLSHQCSQNRLNAAEDGPDAEPEEKEEEEEEFYSPRGSLGDKESLTGTGSSSRRVFPELAAARSSNSRTPSYPSSNSGSPTPSLRPSKSPSPSVQLSIPPSNTPSPSLSPSTRISPPRSYNPSLYSKSPSPTVLVSPPRSSSSSLGSSPSPQARRSPEPHKISSSISQFNGIAVDIGIQQHPPLPAPPPPPPPRPSPPSPPKRKAPSPSPPSSPQRVSDAREEQNSNIPNAFSVNPFSYTNSAPPPPPPPPAGFWETRIPPPLIHPPIFRPPVFFMPSIVAESKDQVAVSQEEMSKDLNDGEKNEETPRPKLKPLHWDKVRASSDRAMVWDQLKSSSFQ